MRYSRYYWHLHVYAEDGRAKEPPAIFSRPLFNLVLVVMRAAKRAKMESSARALSVMCAFKSMDGLQESVGPQLDVPVSATPKQLTELVNSLLKNEERVPYAFYVGDDEVVESIEQNLLQQRVSTEAGLTVRYQPLAVFRVRAVQR